MTTIRDMVKRYLEEHGYGGLAGDECGCDLDDLMVCTGSGSCWAGCEAGHKVPCPGGEDCDALGECSYHIGSRQPTLTVREIVAETLKRDGYDGLVRDGFAPGGGDCFCMLADLMNCDGEYDYCEAGHAVPCPGPKDCIYDGDCSGVHIRSTSDEMD